jgi:CHAT domain-containing protein
MLRIVSNATTNIKTISWSLTPYIISFVGVMSIEFANAQTPGANQKPGTVSPGIVDPGIVTPTIVDPGIVTPPIVDPGVVSPTNVNPNVVDQVPRNPINSCIFGCQKIPETDTKITNPNLSILQTDPTPELKFTSSFINQLGISVPEEVRVNIFQTRDIAQKIEKATGVKPAFIYISFFPVELPATSNPGAVSEQDSDQVEIILVTGQGKPIRYVIPNVTRGKILQVVQEFRTQIITAQYRDRNNYLKPSQQLYNWIIKPIEADLQAQEITNLVFLLDVGLRSTPLAALHNGKQFLVEKYSIGLMPSLTLTNTLYTDIKKSELLAMGISQSTQGQDPLPAVPLELGTLVNKLWTGKFLLNQQTTVENLKSQRRQKPFGIIHLATHADFLGGAVDNSYIQLWENKLRLNQIRQLGLHEPQVEMLVLSACRSALGNEQAEIGFAGLAVLAGVKTSVASLWAVDDTGTAAFMTKFYESLKTAPIRAEALRKAQVAMLKGEVYLKDGHLQGLEKAGNLSLPTESFENPNQSLSHPYYWSAFTMVGNPW